MPWPMVLYLELQLLCERFFEVALQRFVAGNQL